MRTIAVNNLNIEDLFKCGKICSTCPYELKAYCGFVPNEFDESLTYAEE